MIKIILNIDGMACGMCEAHMNDAIRREFKVKKVSSSHAKKETVILTDTDISDDVLNKTVADAGYTLLGVSREQKEKKGLFSGLKKK